MENIRFPLNFSFKIFTPSNDFSVIDAGGHEIAYTRQKIFKIKESVQIFRNSSRNELLFTVKADRIIDFNASYTVRDAAENVLGSIKRSGVKSLWKTSYTVHDAAGRQLYSLQEKNPWIAVLDGLLSEVPIVGTLSGYLFNPSYSVTDGSGGEVFTLKKEPSFFERKFSLHKNGGASSADDILVLNAAMMLMLLERGDG